MSENIAVILANEATLERARSFYADYLQEPQNEYELFRAEEDGVVIVAYAKEKEGFHKMVFQGKNAVKEASIFGTPLPPKEKAKPSVVHPSLFPQIGSDEVGTGDFFGPITVCAAFVDKQGAEYLKRIGVTDSKAMSDDYILSIAPKLLKRFDYSALSVDPAKYNELIAQGLNMNAIKAKLHNRCLLNLKSRHNEAELYVDQFAEAKTYYGYLKEEEEVADGIHFSTKGESLYPSVALASVLARYSFLKKMEELGKKLGKPIPHGAGAVVDAFALDLAKEKGIEALHDLVKTNFANYKKLH